MVLLSDRLICVPPVFGCTDPSFDNYDATATIDDGSCANTYTLNMFDSWGDGWNGNTWTATSTSTGTVYTIASGPYLQLLTSWIF